MTYSEYSARVPLYHLIRAENHQYEAFGGPFCVCNCPESLVEKEETSRKNGTPSTSMTYIQVVYHTCRLATIVCTMQFGGSVRSGKRRFRMRAKTAKLIIWILPTWVLFGRRCITWKYEGWRKQERWYQNDMRHKGSPCMPPNRADRAF